MKRILCKFVLLFTFLVGVINMTNASETHTKYAVIINGVDNSGLHGFCYWHECSAVFQTLLSHDFLKPNIYTAIAGGRDGNVWRDDLNGDGYSDINYIANAEDVYWIFSQLSGIMDNEDDLFIFITGKGGTYNDSAYFELWDGYKIFGNVFSQLLAPISARTINIVMAQSYSGGFINALRGRSNLVITTACQEDEENSFMQNNNFSRFVYRWLSGVNGISPSSMYPDYVIDFIADNADENQDGYVSMEEAYLYALTHDREYHLELAHPQQESYPDCLKQSLSLNQYSQSDCDMLVPFWDLYMKDNTDDKGEEPNISTNQHWITQDIWFEDNGQKVETLLSNNTYDFCVRVHNRGNIASPSNAVLYAHWTKAQIGGSWPEGWFDNSYNCNGTHVQSGDILGSVVLPSIGSGETYVARIPWTTPDSEDYSSCLEFDENNLAEMWHYCVLARIVDAQEQPDITTNLSIDQLVLEYNNVVSRNVIIMSLDNNNDNQPQSTGIVGLTNPTPAQNSGPLTLKCLIDGEYDWNNRASIYLTFSPSFFNNQQYQMSWQNCYLYNPDGVFVIQDSAQFNNIFFDAYDEGFYPIKLDVIYDYIATNETYPTFIIDLILEDWQGVYVGGERFIFNKSINSEPNLVKSVRINEIEEELVEEIIPLDNLIDVDIYNIQGQLILRCNSTLINDLKLPRGVYIIHSNDNSHKQKIIK